ncbi:flagellar hook-length control [Fusarium heterosporum]|uniref:Flagellar hook-length control n=1 Tax=Fusarium heterosporum TaxID=42747 RepID=A0A8H5TMI6_FUSHE|nr:flagellar hook-length control [Fusarium heterosporum]
MGKNNRKNKQAQSNDANQAPYGSPQYNSRYSSPQYNWSQQNAPQHNYSHHNQPKYNHTQHNWQQQNPRQNPPQHNYHHQNPLQYNWHHQNAPQQNHPQQNHPQHNHHHQTPTKRSNGVVTLTRNNEECRLIFDVLNKYLAPFEIPRYTTLIEHRPWHLGGIYTTFSAEPILPHVWEGITVRVVKHDHLQHVQIFLAVRGSLTNSASIPPMHTLQTSLREYLMDNGIKIGVQIEESVHGQWLAAYIQELAASHGGGGGDVEMNMW